VHENNSFSILVDLSTSRVSGLHVLVVVFQYIDHNKPTLHLFGAYAVSTIYVPVIDANGDVLCIMTAKYPAGIKTRRNKATQIAKRSLEFTLLNIMLRLHCT
jgi:hypothetical protein